MALWTYTARIDGTLTVGELEASDAPAANRAALHLLQRHGRHVAISRVFLAPALRPAIERFAAGARVFQAPPRPARRLAAS
jgi:hypothetical protein